MPKRTKPLDTPRQLRLPFGPTPAPPFLAGAGRTKEAIREAIKMALENCELKREEIASELSRLTGESISVHVINSWTAESKSNWRMPLEYLSALFIITQNIEIIKASIVGTGLSIITASESKLLELGRLTAEEMKRKKKKRIIVEELGL